MQDDQLDRDGQPIRAWPESVRLALLTSLGSATLSIASLFLHYYSARSAADSQFSTVDYEQASQNRLDLIESFETLNKFNDIGRVAYDSMIKEVIDPSKNGKSFHVITVRNVEKFAKIYLDETIKNSPSSEEISKFHRLVKTAKYIHPNLTSKEICELFEIENSSPKSKFERVRAAGKELRDGRMGFDVYKYRVIGFAAPTIPARGCVPFRDFISEVSISTQEIREHSKL